MSAWPVHRLPPGDAEAVGELGAQGGVVDPADRALLLLEEPGVERQPPPGRVLDLGRDDGVGVQLRVHRPRTCAGGTPPRSAPGCRPGRRRPCPGG